MSAFEEGVKARTEGKSVDKNPYPRYTSFKNSFDNLEWARGWAEANYGDECGTWRARYESV